MEDQISRLVATTEEKWKHVCEERNILRKAEIFQRGYALFDGFEKASKRQADLLNLMERHHHFCGAVANRDISAEVYLSRGEGVEGGG